MKPKLSVYLSDHVAERLALAARRPGANKSAIVDAALDRFPNPERDPSGDAALVRAFDDPHANTFVCGGHMGKSYSSSHDHPYPPARRSLRGRAQRS